MTEDREETALDLTVRTLEVRPQQETSAGDCSRTYYFTEVSYRT